VSNLRFCHVLHSVLLSAPVEPWLVELSRGEPEAAWAAFLDRHRGLLFASIRHYVHDHDDVMDAFTWVCEGLRAHDFRRLRAYADETNHRAQFTTWLVTVVRHLTVDWLRSRDGRERPLAVEAQLTGLQREILEEVFAQRRSHVEAYELIRSRDEPALTFGGFLRELATVHRAVTAGRGRLAREMHVPPPTPPVNDDCDFISSEESRRILGAALVHLSEEDRVAVQMYVVDELPAAEVARVLGLGGAKAVYNRVYRALAAIREVLERAGLARDDL
jgi:RNA polymerase sigma factor (sigma-70 family)